MTQDGSMFSAKAVIEGKWVAIMRHERTDRAMILTPYRTRCLRQGDIHEFLLCPLDAHPAERIDTVAYLGFGEISEGGVAEAGDSLYRGDRLIGTIVGFDATHAPNHYNIVIRAERLSSGHALGLSVAEGFSIRPSIADSEPESTQ